MNLPANFPLKKVIITVVSVVIVIALIITGVTVAVNGKAAKCHGGCGAGFKYLHTVLG